MNGAKNLPTGSASPLASSVAALPSSSSSPLDCPLPDSSKIGTLARMVVLGAPSSEDGVVEWAGWRWVVVGLWVVKPAVVPTVSVVLGGGRAWTMLPGSEGEVAVTAVAALVVVVTPWRGGVTLAWAVGGMVGGVVDLAVNSEMSSGREGGEGEQAMEDG